MIFRKMGTENIIKDKIYFTCKMEEETVTLPKPPDGYKYRLVTCDYDRDRNKESCRKYREQNKDKVKEQNKSYYEKNKERIKEQKRLQYEAKKGNQ
jgi:hypothetical protein